MNKQAVVIDLSDIPEAERAEKLVGFMDEKRHIFVDIAQNEHVIFTGYGVHMASCEYEQDKFPPIKLWSDNKQTDVLAFLEKKIPETHQSRFEVIGDLSGLPKPVLKKIKLDKIDWDATVNVCMPKIKIQTSANSDTKITIVSIEDKPYTVRVDALYGNDDDKEILACRKHLLDVYQQIE